MLSESRILLVGDEGLARKKTEQVLSRSGFKVATVDNLGEGLAVLEKAQLSEKPFQIAVLGLRFSGSEVGITGESVGVYLRQLLEISPQLPVVLMDADMVIESRISTNNHREHRAYIEEKRGDSLVKLIHDILGNNAEW